jgi:hypothetical protein
MIAHAIDLYLLQDFSTIPSKMSSTLNASAKPFTPASADTDFALVSAPIAEPDSAAFS